MKMAKASDADLKMATDLCMAIENLTGWYPTVPPEIERLKDEDENERFDSDDREQCVRVLNHLIQVSQRGSLLRVIWGAAVMLDPANKLVDPTADTIEHHPERARLIEALERLSRRGHLNESTCADEATNADLCFAAEALAAAKGGA